MAKNISFYWFIFLASNSLNCQILNIDRENGQDSIYKKVRYSTEINFTADKQKNDLIDVITYNELIYSLKNNTIFIFFGKTDFAYNGNTPLENNGYFQIRFRDNDTRRIYPDIFCQYQWNSVQGIEYRFLLGANARIRWFEKRDVDLYSKFGLFYEVEKWNPFLVGYGFNNINSQIINRDFVRFNSSIKYARKISSNFDIAIVNYLQIPLFKSLILPRWYLDINLNILLTKKWTFVVHYENIYDSFRALPIDNFFYSLTFGGRYSF